ncbi:MAG TPA: hypothetical protein VI976_02350 [Candidatus Omnitrophota bacterium]|nr:hypothetical protein [Candidatus Omnitrophota bacterium]
MASIPCDICGRPAEVKPFPGASPQSGAWCDLHYGVCAWLSTNGRYGFFLWLGLTLASTMIISLAMRDGALNFILRLVILLVIVFILQNMLYFLLMKPKKKRGDYA